MATEKTETARERTVRLADKRVNAAIDKIRLIGNLSGPQYETTQTDVEQIETALYNAVDAQMKRFGKMTADRPQFSLTS
jgi:hypothetical protein